MAGRSKTWAPFKVPEDAISCGFHEAVRGVLSHHVVIRDGKIANYHPYPPTCWNANPRDVYGTPGPYEDAVQNTPLFEENGPDKLSSCFAGITVIRCRLISPRSAHVPSRSTTYPGGVPEPRLSTRRGMCLVHTRLSQSNRADTTSPHDKIANTFFTKVLQTRYPQEHLGCVKWKVFHLDMR